MEALADAVRLRRHRLRFRMVNVVDSQIQLIIMLLNFTTVLCSPISKTPSFFCGLSFRSSANRGVRSCCASPRSVTSSNVLFFAASLLRAVTRFCVISPGLRLLLENPRTPKHIQKREGYSAIKALAAVNNASIQLMVYGVPSLNRG